MTNRGYKNSSLDIQRAKELRRQSSIVERMLWNALLPLKKEAGIKFRRQHPLHPYIADFACAKARLIIELDGQSHDTRLPYDTRHETALRNMGWAVMRFTNDDVLTNLDGVVEIIMKKTRDQLSNLLPVYGEDAKT